MKCNNEKFWVTDVNYLEDIVSKYDLPEHVDFYDLTLREGDQTPGCILNAEEKIEIAKELDKLGVNVIELFAMVSEEDRIALKELSKPGVLKHAKIASLARPLPGDIEAVAKCGVKRIGFEGPGNPWIAEHVMGMSEEDIINNFVKAIKLAKSYGIEEIAVGAWDCVRGNTPEFLEKFIKKVVEAGATEICYADTFGFTLPWTVQYMIRKYKEWAGEGVVISCHFHNDYGLATANTLAAVSAGCSSVQVSMNGLGERFGNTPLDEVAINLALNMDVKTDINLEKIYPLSKKIESMSGIKIAENKPMVGKRGFMMGSGLVVDMLEKSKEDNMAKAYLPFMPELIGRPNYEVVYGKGVGRNMMISFMKEMGFNPTKEESKEITEMVKKESIEKKSLLSEDRVREIVNTYMENNR